MNKRKSEMTWTIGSGLAEEDSKASNLSSLLLSGKSIGWCGPLWTWPSLGADSTQSGNVKGTAKNKSEETLGPLERNVSN